MSSQNLVLETEKERTEQKLVTEPVKVYKKVVKPKIDLEMLWNRSPEKGKKGVTTDKVVFNFKHSWDRLRYSKAGHIYIGTTNIEGDTLFYHDNDRVIHHPLVIIGETDIIINGWAPNTTCMGYAQQLIRMFPSAPQIPLPILETMEHSSGSGISISDFVKYVRVIDKEADRWEKVEVEDPETGEIKEKEIHKMPSVVFMIDESYHTEIHNNHDTRDDFYLSSIDQSSPTEPYFLVWLEEPAYGAKESFFQISNLSEEDYKDYQDNVTVKVKIDDETVAKLLWERQGEFFFKRIGTVGQLKEYLGYPKNYSLNKEIKKWGDLAVIFRPEQTGSNQHSCRDVLEIMNLLEAKSQVFVRGTVRHPEHTMMRFGSTWYQTTMNRVRGAWAVESGRGRID
jgi:hypothetical protein